jgi:hypothetical protein
MNPLRIVSLFLLLSFSAILSAARATPWKVERSLGSSQLSLASLEQIVVPDDANAALLAAVADLKSVYSDRITAGRKTLSETVSTERMKQSILLSLREPFDSTGGFSITRQRTQITIEAASQAGLVNGIYALCADVFGARWYWSGDLGLEYVGDVPAKFPAQRWVESPAFKQRRLHPMNTDYGRRNRLNSAFEFNHALAKVFTPQRFEDTPEVFSIVNGRKRVPTGSGGTDPQPHLAHPKAVELAVDAALDHFEKNPQSRSYSLSINDNVLFDETELTQAQVTPLKYFRTRPDYTDYVFGFMNAVAEQVFEVGGAWQNQDGEDRYLTALSYYWTEPSPSIAIHPRVMPVLTSDRAQWHDPLYRAEDKALIKRWAESGAERVATWDYYFGAPYPYPRQFNQWIIESLRHLNANGVDILFSQLPSVWGMDGAKAWLTSELLWDPFQDAEALLGEYYINFFGAASGPIRGFYEYAEQYRNENEGKADWIKFYKDEAGVGLFDERALSEMRALLRAAADSVVSDPRRAERVQVVSEAFTFTEIYAAYHRSRGDLVDATLQESSALEGALNRFRSARERYEGFAPTFVAKPEHSRLNRFSRQLQSDPEAMAQAKLAKLNRLPEAEGTLSLNALAKDPEVFRSTFKNVELSHAGTYTRNFLGPELPRVSHWFSDFRPSEHLKVTGLRDGETGMRISGADVFSFFRDVPVTPESVFVLRADLRWQISPDNRTQIKLVWLDRNGNRLRTDIPLQLPWGGLDDFKQIEIPFYSPKRAYDVRIHFVASRQYPGDFLELRSVDFGELFVR